jgi:putative ABC transport system permease protein
VLGILPREFIFPGAEDAELAVPLSLMADARRTERGSNFLRIFGRLSPGADASRAGAELSSITARLRDLYPDENAKLTAPRVLPLTEEVVGGSRPLLLVLSGAVGLLLLVACANMAGLTLVRGLGRRAEVAIRKALGAGSLRLVRPFFLEAILLSGAGALAAVVLARESVPLLLSFAPSSLPRASAAAVDTTVLLFTAALALACAFLCGVGPAIAAARSPAAGRLGRLTEDPAAGRGGLARRAFVVAQVALSLTLLAGAALLSKSFARLTSVDPGFSSERVLSVRLTLGKARYPDAEAAARFYEQATARLAELPGVEAAGAASVLPLSGMNARQDFEIVGKPAAKASETPGAQSRWVDAAYFETLGIPLRRGREFTDRDDGRAPGVAIVDDVLAHQLFPGGDAVGSRLRLEDAEERPREAEIVGVVGGVKHFALEEEPLGTLYLPVAQIPENMLALLLNNSNLVVRTSVDPLSAAGAVRRTIRSVDRDLATGSVRTMEDIRGAALAARRFTAMLFALFALSAAALAGVGLYGTLAQLVAQDRRPIGIRLALGASPSAVLRHVAGRGLRLTLGGVAAGLALALTVSRLLTASLYEVSPADPQSFAFAAALLLAVAAAACIIPARRASRVDPIAVLKAD